MNSEQGIYLNVIAALHLWIEAREVKAGSSRLLLFLAGYRRWGMDAERWR